MSNPWDGVPARPELSGWHWVEDATGLRPLLWRGGDWPESVDRFEWEDGVVVCSAADMRGSQYFGLVAMPDAATDVFRRTRLAPYASKQRLKQARQFR
jgi:hypothetical protein